MNDFSQNALAFHCGFMTFKKLDMGGSATCAVFTATTGL